MYYAAVLWYVDVMYIIVTVPFTFVCVCVCLCVCVHACMCGACVRACMCVPVLEVTVGHWPFSDQFQPLANQNRFWSAKFPVHFQWDSSQ